MPDRIYYALPGYYTIGEEFDSLREAAIRAVGDILDADRSNRDRGTLVPLWRNIDVRLANENGDRILTRCKLTLEMEVL